MVVFDAEGEGAASNRARGVPLLCVVAGVRRGAGDGGDGGGGFEVWVAGPSGSYSAWGVGMADVRGGGEARGVAGEGGRGVGSGGRVRRKELVVQGSM